MANCRFRSYFRLDEFHAVQFGLKFSRGFLRAGPTDSKATLDILLKKRPDETKQTHRRDQDHSAYRVSAPVGIRTVGKIASAPEDTGALEVRSEPMRTNQRRHYGAYARSQRPLVNNIHGS